jgi:hypothetical protein
VLIMSLAVGLCILLHASLYPCPGPRHPHAPGPGLHALARWPGPGDSRGLTSLLPSSSWLSLVVAWAIQTRPSIPGNLRYMGEG